MIRRLLATLMSAMLIAAALASGAVGNTAEQLLKQTGVHGGVVIVLGCQDPALLLELGRSDAYLVQGLDEHPEAVEKARAAIQAEGLYGGISVDRFDGPALPYVDDLVNLIVVAGEGVRVESREMARVLRPGGVIVTRGDGKRFTDALESRRMAMSGWLAAVKPVSQELDDWSHLLHGPNNNAVSKDLVVGPVSGLKWTCGPLWSRSHEFTSSLSVLVSAGGRVFYVVDEGLTSITTPDIPERWVLIARDAFNGKQLWRMPLPQWRSRLGSKTALRSVPATAQRCVVADEDQLFVSALLGDSVQVLDAATGEVLATHEASKGTREFVKVGESLVLYQQEVGSRKPGRVARVGASSGELLWAAPNDGYRAESLAASEKYVIYHNGKELVCLDSDTGHRLWPNRQREENDRQQPRRLSQATFILHEDLVVQAEANRLVALRADTGEVVWQSPTGGKAMRGQDCFVARGYVWHASGDMIVGYDLKTGEPAKTVDPTSVQSLGHHLRCYRAKATENYLITQYRGVEFVSITGKPHYQTDWARGACSFGVVPANGLLYVPPNPCFCYPGVKIRGLNALAPKPAGEGIQAGTSVARLVRGPAFGRQLGSSPSITDTDWPTYRHDSMRHGSTDTAVGPELAQNWSIDLGTKLSPPVAALGRVYVAAKDRHTVVALDAASGRTSWSFTAGGRIDSPPTIYDGTASSQPLCLFGSVDGWLYCVTADDGELVWKFRAAPHDRRIVSFDQLESAWPVHGSVLVTNGVVYCTAGRSSMLDGGIWLYGLKPETGEVLYETHVDTLSRTRQDAEGKPFIPSYVMEGGLSDILVSEGDRIFMGPLVFDLQLNRLETPYEMEGEQKTVAMDISKEPYVKVDADMAREGYEGYRMFHRWEQTAWPELTADYTSRFGGFNLGDMKTGRHIAPTAGFLDDSWFNRTYWMYSDIWPGWYHAHRGAKTGQLLVVGPKRTYAVQSYPDRNRQSPLFTPGSYGYLLFADENDTEPVLDYKTRSATKGLGFTRLKPPVWHDWVPIRIRAMVKAGDVLFVAGPPDVVPEDDPLAAFEGRRGGVLRAVSAEDGAVMSEQQLDAPPVFDGVIAAAGRLFVTTEDHRLVCFKE